MSKFERYLLMMNGNGLLKLLNLILTNIFWQHELLK